MNYDYITNQLFYKLSSNVKLPAKYTDTRFYEWSEFSDDEELIKSIGEIITMLDDNSTPIDLGEKLKSTSKEDSDNFNERVKQFIKDHIDIKKIPVNKHRYELQLSLDDHQLSPPMIHENNGRQKLMYPNEARLRNFTYASDLYITVTYKTKMFYGEGLVSVLKKAMKKDVKDKFRKTSNYVEF